MRTQLTRHFNELLYAVDVINVDAVLLAGFVGITAICLGIACFGSEL